MMFRTLPMLGALLFALAAPASAAGASQPQVLVRTSAGEFVIELYPDKAPATVENFLKYVDDKFYDGSIFHRVIGNFMIQGGGFTKDLYQNGLQPKTTPSPIKLEARNGLRNDRGWVAMARTSNPDSATSQFFINTVDNASLNLPQPDGHGYAVFGRVVCGMDVVDMIRAVATRKVGPYSDVPSEPVVIESITRVGAAG